MTQRQTTAHVDRPRMLVLGASNVRLGWRSLLDVAHDLFQRPFDAHLVMGHGRSLAQTTTFLRTSYRGLLHSVAWDCLAKQPEQPTFLLLTDIGNDVLYGVDADQILEWVDQIVCRAATLTPVMVVTRPPMRSIERLPAWRFHLFRRLLWPSSQVSYTEALRTASAVDRGLARRFPAMAGQLTVELVAPSSQWYGIDPVHVRRRSRRAAWQSYLAPWRAHAGALEEIRAQRPIAGSWFRRLHLPRAIDHADQYRRDYSRLPDGSFVRYYVG